MNRTLAFASAVTLLAVAHFASAARREITMDMINTTLHEEGAPLGSPGHLVFYPANLEVLPSGDTLPLLVNPNWDTDSKNLGQ